MQGKVTKGAHKFGPKKLSGDQAWPKKYADSAVRGEKKTDVSGAQLLLYPHVRHGAGRMLQVAN